MLNEIQNWNLLMKFLTLIVILEKKGKQPIFEKQEGE